MRLTDYVKIWYFSVKHKFQLFDPSWYGLAWPITDQCMIGFLMPFAGDITQQELGIIFNASSLSLLFSQYKRSEKTMNESLLHIKIGSYDCAEMCELLRFYILYILGKVYGVQNVDDGLVCLRKISGPVLMSWMLHSIYAREDTSLIRNQTIHIPISMWS